MGQEEEPSAAALFEVLADDHSRQILLAADGEPKTAKTLSEYCDVSLATVYRRVATLQDHGLLEERSTVDDDGSHRRRFVTTLEELHVDLSEGDLSVAVEVSDDLADSFTSLWSDLRENT
ncbi:helix-turn-helix domain-containing protein [Haloglomus salinum]|jgi:DNA-binding transcriptional ArsR family regulator|uniref:helix-turn-helix domain-containing protein n=1 Tax=Haloglomus salinum TaxID=2962673 RepID=UPI0020C9E4CF|nr:helix-turn-helix domain-containing protein [Haloglomus salinum]